MATNSNPIIWKTTNVFNFFFAFLESTLNLKHFEKKSLIAQTFLKLLNLTDLLTSMHKRSCF